MGPAESRILVELKKNANRPNTDIAAVTGAEHSYVGKIRKRHGFPLPPKSKKPPGTNRLIEIEMLRGKFHQEWLCKKW